MKGKSSFRTKNEQKAVGLLDICVVIPVQNNEEYLLAVFHGVDNQSLLPKEIVIVDSSSNNKIATIINEWSGEVPIKYIKIGSAYPGDARNVGVEIVKSEWIAFLDSTTVPEHDWLERCVEMAIEKKVDFVGGLALFEADTYFKKLLRATTYGCSPMVHCLDQ
jgi:glycosyltransferase involved in cell wall biosynthesis